MSAEELLKGSEEAALSNNQIVSTVEGKVKSNKKKRAGSLGAVLFIMLMLGGFLIVFGMGNLVPAAISERLVEETDVQYADAVQSKMLVFQQALLNGNIPDDTTSILKDKGVLVGVVGENGEFTEVNKSDSSLSLKMDDEIIGAEDFINRASNDARLYSAFNDATYSRAAYYYDDAAKKVFKRIGTNRNNYTENSKLDEVMDSSLGKGSDVSINSVFLEQKTRTNPSTGEEEVYYEYTENGAAANSKGEASSFISAVGNKNSASTSNIATLNSADELKVADTISKEQRSSLFYMLFMENISKMKAGDGNSSKINEAMDFLYQSEKTQVVDVETGEVVEYSGTPLDSPSLYAILSGEKVDVNKVDNFSSERILKTIKNQIRTNETAEISNTVASSSSKVRGSIGRLISNGVAGASSAILETVSPTINKSLMNNSFETIKGIDAGEFLVEGAVNVGKELAKASGGSPGDAEAVSKYARLNNQILAMEAKVDRDKRSPFDITSKNTFLGSIVYNLAVGGRKDHGSLLSGFNSMITIASSSMISMLPSTYADTIEGYLSSYGNCETYDTINAVGSAGCAEIATFDVSTLNNPYGDPGFISFMEKNTTLDSSGVRKINNNSELSNFIINNDERITPLGVVDGGILDSLSSGSSSISFINSISELVKKFIGASEGDKRIATGAAFVNSTSNPDWNTYKYAQRYVSLARATSALKQYTKDKTAYNDLLYFEGPNNPVMAFLEEYYAAK